MQAWRSSRISTATPTILKGSATASDSSYENTYLELRGKQLNAYAVSLGLGLPLKGMKTMVNLGAQAGRKRNNAEDLIKESYFKFVVGFSIYDKWFVKRKYY